MQVDQPELLERLVVALALGMLMGLERGWEQRELAEGQRVAGIRTFGLVSLLGGVAALLGGENPGTLLAAMILALGTLAAVGYWRMSERHDDLSITSAAAALLAFTLGALAGRGQLVPAASAAVVVTLVLGAKPELHGLIERIDRAELLATIRLLLFSVVLLPILPDRGYGPWQALNPYQLWWMVVIVASISYVGYFAVRILGGQRGVLLTGVLGGMVSSTAVAVSLSRIGRQRPELEQPLAMGVIAASSIMFPRILVIVAAIAPLLVRRLAWPLMAASAAGFAIAGWYAIRLRKTGEVPADHAGRGPRNPLDLRTAVEFVLILTAVMIATRAAQAWLGRPGLYVVAALSGVVDVDAISLSLASMPGGSASGTTAAAGIMIASAMNTASKSAIVYAIGGRAMGTRVALALGGSLVVVMIGLWPLLAS
jgi:uncharacterized membrane protein (DUF4010 family)